MKINILDSFNKDKFNCYVCKQYFDKKEMIVILKPERDIGGAILDIERNICNKCYPEIEFEHIRLNIIQ